GGGQGLLGKEEIISRVYERMRTGRIRIFSTQRELLEQLRMYHYTSEGGRVKVVAENDDLISAMHYAIIMLRYALTEEETRPMSYGVRAESYDPINAIMG